MVDVNRAVRVLGCNLLRGLFSRCGTGENLVVSPYAAMVTLSLLTAGAEEDTERELGEALEVRLPLIHPAMRRILVFPPAEGAPTLEEEQPFFCMANKVLVGSALPLNKSYRQIGHRIYRTVVEAADFGQDPEEERRRANQYCRLGAGVTGDILPESCFLSADTGIVLLSSAAVCTASWKHPVTEKLRPFGDVEAAPTLRSCAMYGYAQLQWPSLQAVEVLFSCEALSATVLLPSGNLDELCESLTPEVLEDVFSAVRSDQRRVILELPVVTAETGSDLEPVLRDMGVTLAFGQEAAFQRITPTATACLSWVMHRARLEIVAGSASSMVSRAYQHIVENIPATSTPALPDLELLVNKPFVLCVRRMDTLLLLACIQAVR